MIAHRRSDVADLNRRARSLLRDAGRLGPDALRTDGGAFAVGDRVITTRNDRSLAVVNGQGGTLTALHDGRVHIDLDNGRRVDLPESYAQDGYLDHGYAATAHRAQGATVDRAFVLGSDELYREWGYTALSRHRGEVRFYITASQAFLNHAPEPLRDGDIPLHVAQMLADSRRAPRLGQGQGSRHRHRTGPVTTQLSFEEGRHAPRGLTRAELMTAREVAELISVPISTVREWGRNGTLPRVKLGRHVRYIRRHVEAAILGAEEGPQQRSAVR